jgi:hypothetical protein
VLAVSYEFGTAIAPYVMDPIVDAISGDWFSKKQFEREGDGTRGKTVEQIREPSKTS